MNCGHLTAFLVGFLIGWVVYSLVKAAIYSKF